MLAFRILPFVVFARTDCRRRRTSDRARRQRAAAAGLTDAAAAGPGITATATVTLLLSAGSAPALWQPESLSQCPQRTEHPNFRMDVYGYVWIRMDTYGSVWR